MPAWTSIAFYLSKDIWSRWLETPGAALVRLAVAAGLGAALLLAQAGFQLAGRSLEERIARFGASAVIVTEPVVPDRLGRAGLGRLLAPGAPDAVLLAVRQVPLPAEDELGTRYAVLLYGPESLPALAAAGDRGTGLFALGSAWPAGATLRVRLDGTEQTATARAAPAALAGYGADKPLLLVPAELGAGTERNGFIETAVLSLDGAEPAAVRALAGAVRLVLAADQRAQAAVQSPDRLFDELDRLRAVQARWAALTGLAGGALVALLFGSISILEYRQNRFIAALLRSFGAPGGWLLARYLAESLLLAALALGLATLAVRGVHAPLFRAAGLEPGLLARTGLAPYAGAAVWAQGRWLLLGAVLAVAPVAVALRQPVGRVLS